MTPNYNMHNIILIEQRVMQRLIEAGKSRSKGGKAGTWSDIDNGRGGSIYNRAEPRKRASSKAGANAALTAAGAQWDAMTPEARDEMMAVEMGGYDANSRADIAQVSWSELPDVIGSDKMQKFAYVIKLWNR